MPVLFTDCIGAVVVEQNAAKRVNYRHHFEQSHHAPDCFGDDVICLHPQFSCLCSSDVEPRALGYFFVNIKNLCSRQLEF